MKKDDLDMDLASAAELMVSDTPNSPPPQIPSWYFDLPEYEEYKKALEKLPLYPRFEEQLDNMLLPGKFDEAALNSALHALEASKTPETKAAGKRLQMAVLKKYPPNKKTVFCELVTLAHKRYGDAENAIVRYVADKYNKGLFSPKDTAAAESRSFFVHKAARTGDSEGLVKALNDGADVDAKDIRGQTALFAACAYGKVRCVEILLDAGCDVNTRDENNDTPLHYAAWCGKENCVALLLARGADVTCKNNEDKTPLDHTLHDERLIKIRKMFQQLAVSDQV